MKLEHLSSLFLGLFCVQSFSNCFRHTEGISHSSFRGLPTYQTEFQQSNLFWANHRYYKGDFGRRLASLDATRIPHRHNKVHVVLKAKMDEHQRRRVSQRKGHRRNHEAVSQSNAGFKLQNSKEQQQSDMESLNNSPCVAWIHYHKTGHDLIKELGSILESLDMVEHFWNGRNPKVHKLNRSYQRFNFANESVTCRHLNDLPLKLNPLPKVQLFGLEATEFFCDGWSDSMPSSFKLVHFVRDPFEMSLSAYLYHSQHPTPERWVLDPNIVPCKYSRPFLEYVAERLNMTMGDLDPVIELCQSLFPPNSKNYYEGLTSLSMYDGLRLETTRFIISRDCASGGDILRMAANAMEFARIKNHSQVSTVYMKNFTSDYANTEHSIERLMKFSFQGSNIARSNEMEAARRYIARYKIEVAKGVHVTKRLLSGEDRMDLISKLEDDDVLGPVLKRVQAVIQNGSENQKTRGSGTVMNN